MPLMCNVQRMDVGIPHSRHATLYAVLPYNAQHFRSLQTRNSLSIPGSSVKEILLLVLLLLCRLCYGYDPPLPSFTKETKE